MNNCHVIWSVGSQLRTDLPLPPAAPGAFERPPPELHTDATVIRTFSAYGVEPTTTFLARSLGALGGSFMRLPGFTVLSLAFGEWPTVGKTR